MENEVGCYLILGAYTEKLRKRANLKMEKYVRKYTSATLLLMI